MPQSWRGVLPCADCEGIETSLFLEKDGTWVMNERYLGAREEPSSFASYGTWARTADKLVLTDSKGEKSYYRAKGDALEMLDREGNPIESQFNYTLEPAQSSLPMTPMTLRGMYFYMADAATFTDCATGKRFMVANNAPEYRNIGFEEFLDGGNGVIARGRVARTVGEKDAVWIHFQHIFRRSLRRNDGQATALSTRWPGRASTSALWMRPSLSTN